MNFPIEPNSKSSDFANLFGPDGGYFSALKNNLITHKSVDAVSKESLFEDFCEIGQFLADKNAFLEALLPLENKLRSLVDQAAKMSLRSGLKVEIEKINRGIGSAGQVFKTHKLLTEALSESEIMHGFNNPDVSLQRLHSKAFEYDFDEPGWKKRHSTNPEGKSTSTRDVNLAKGTPTVLDGISGMDFNNILLRHGYQFKDVGAGARHGEYAHRLQWYAICNSNALTLKNTPLQIFKCMGLMLCGSDILKKSNSPLHLYIWEALFDAGKDDKQAHNVLKSAAYTNGTFHCPEVLTMFLVEDPMQGLNPDEPLSLWYLRTLVRSRYYKRFREGPQEPNDRIYQLKAKKRFEQNRIEKVFTSYQIDNHEARLTGPMESFGCVPALIWYVNNA